MYFDIRIPIGILFTVIGVLLMVQGLVVDMPARGAAAAHSINALWGAVLVVFGSSMLLLAARNAARRRRAASRHATTNGHD